MDKSNVVSSSGSAITTVVETNKKVDEVKGAEETQKKIVDLDKASCSIHSDEAVNKKSNPPVCKENQEKQKICQEGSKDNPQGKRQNQDSVQTQTLSTLKDTLVVDKDHNLKSDTSKLDLVSKSQLAHTLAQEKAADGQGVCVNQETKSVVGGDENIPAVNDVDVSFGDNSVTTTNITETLLIDDVSTVQAPPNFIQNFSVLMRDATNQVTNINDAISITSFISQSAPGGGIRPPQNISGRAMPYRIGRIPGDNRTTLEVRFTPAKEIGHYDRAPLEKLYNAGVPSDRFIISALQPRMRVANNNVLRSISGYIEQNWEVFDNSAMYAKLLYWSLVRDCYTFINVIPVATPFPDEFTPLWINLDAVEPIIADYITAITSKSIILVEERDFCLEDLQAIYWMAKPGYRIEGPDADDAPVFHNTYLNWSGIHVTIMAHGPAPAVPVPVLLSAEKLITFSSKLATNRNEWDSYMKGLYIALDAVGLRYTERERMFYPLRSSLSYMNIQLPQPADYNFMFRLMDLFPSTLESSRVEVIAWAALRSQDRIRAAALYTAVLASASTTTLYGLNITTEYLVEWGLGADTPPFLNEIMSSILNTPAFDRPDVDVSMFKTPKKAFPIWLGCSIPDNLYPGSYWNGSYGSQPNANASFFNYPIAYTPQLFSPLVCDNWLKVRPIEWGINAPQPKANFKSEVRVVGAPRRQGWYSSLGSKDYANLVTSDCPIKLATYANLALNVILQFLDNVEQPLLSRQVGAWAPGTETQWDAPQPIPNDNFAWVAALRVVQPCTLMSYDYRLQDVYAPCYLNPNLGIGDAIALSNFQGQPVESAGVALNSAFAPHTPFRLPASINLSAIASLAIAPKEDIAK